MELKKAEFKVGGMSCKHCVEAVRQGIEALPGIDALDVVVGRVRVEFDGSQVNTNQVIAAIADAGYDVDLV